MLNLLHRVAFPRLALLLLGAVLSLSASAQVYKCVDGTGKTAYQSQPCPEATRSAQLDVKSVSALPSTLSANGSAGELRQAVVANCMSQAARSAPALARIATEQPRKFRDFCDCTADGAMAQIGKVKELVGRGDNAGLEQLGMRVGFACASRLQ